MRKSVGNILNMNKLKCQELILRILYLKRDSKSPKALIDRRKLKKQNDNRSISPRFLWLSKYTRNKERLESEMLSNDSPRRFKTLNNDEKNRTRMTSLLSRVQKSVYLDRYYTQEVQANEQNHILTDTNQQQKDNRGFARSTYAKINERRISKTSNQSRPQSKISVIEPMIELSDKNTLSSKFTQKNLYATSKERLCKTKKSKTKKNINPSQLMTQKMQLQHHLLPHYKRNLTAYNNYKSRLLKQRKEKSQMPIRPWDYEMEMNDQCLFENL